MGFPVGTLCWTRILGQGREKEKRTVHSAGNVTGISWGDCDEKDSNIRGHRIPNTRHRVIRSIKNLKETTVLAILGLAAAKAVSYVVGVSI
jgi:hypothetical protein